MRRAEKEDSFGFRKIKRLVCPSCGRTRVGIACMSARVQHRHHIWKDWELTHGAIMILAPRTGSCLPSIEDGTWASHRSSSAERVEPREEYQEPAWLATLVVILAGGDQWVCLWFYKMYFRTNGGVFFLIISLSIEYWCDGDGDGDSASDGGVRLTTRLMWVRGYTYQHSKRSNSVCGYDHQIRQIRQIRQDLLVILLHLSCHWRLILFFIAFQKSVVISNILRCSQTAFTERSQIDCSFPLGRKATVYLHLTPIPGRIQSSHWEP